MPNSRYDDPNHKPDGNDLLAALAVLAAREPDRRLEVDLSSIARTDFLVSGKFEIRDGVPYIIIQREAIPEEVMAGAVSPIVRPEAPDAPAD